MDWKTELTSIVMFFVACWAQRNMNLWTQQAMEAETVGYLYSLIVLAQAEIPVIRIRADERWGKEENRLVST